MNVSADLDRIGGVKKILAGP